MGTLLYVEASVNEITIDQLISLISERPGAMPISFVARTRIKLNKFSRKETANAVQVMENGQWRYTISPPKCGKLIGQDTPNYVESDDGTKHLIQSETWELPKTACPFGEVWKTATVIGWVNCSYKNAWEKETGEEYVAGESWHDASLDENERLTPFAEHKDGGKLYLRVMRPKTLESSIQADGGTTTYADLAPYMAPPRDEPVVPFRTYGLSGLREVTFGGETYQIVTTQTVLEREETKLMEMMV